MEVGERKRRIVGMGFLGFSAIAHAVVGKCPQLKMIDLGLASDTLFVGGHGGRAGRKGRCEVGCTGTRRTDGSQQEMG